MKFRVWVRSLPAIGRTYYAGYVDIDVRSWGDIERAALTKLKFIHGHRDWTITETKQLDRSTQGGSG